MFYGNGLKVLIDRFVQKMSWMLIIIIFLNAVAIFVHIIAMTLLISWKENCTRDSQRLLLIALCTTELIYSIGDIILYCFALLDISNIGTTAIDVFNTATVTFFYIFIMTMISFDRFLEIRLNIKYNIYWSVKKTKIVLFGALALCLLTWIPLFTLATRSSYSFSTRVIHYIFPILVFIFLLIASFSYFYITKQVLKHRRNARRIEQQLQKNNKIVYDKKTTNRFKLFVPTLIILTFLLFMVTPKTIKIFVDIGLTSEFTYEITFMFLPIGFITDAIIYIFNVNGVRQVFKNMIWRRNVVRPIRPSFRTNLVT